MTIDYRAPPEAMIYFPPYIAGLVLVGDALNIKTLLDLVAVAIVLAGVFVVARYRAALAAADATAKAWKDERDAAVARAERKEEELVRERAENAALKMRPDLETLTDLVRGQKDDMQVMADRIVAAIEGRA